MVCKRIGIGHAAAFKQAYLSKTIRLFVAGALPLPTIPSVNETEPFTKGART